MRIIRDFIAKLAEANELVTFLWSAKLWFLIPFIILMLLFGFVFIFAQSTGIAPFMYTLF